MAEEPIASGKDQGERSEAEPNSVFSNLPASRPGTRSPRRDGAKAAKAQADTAQSGKPKAAAKAKAAPKRERSTESQAAPPAGTGPRSEPEPQSQSEPPSQAEPFGAGGLEDIAWAGVAVAAEAATLGVRLATKAFEALRQGTDHR